MYLWRLKIMDETRTKITTLRSRCKVCGKEFTYERRGRLTGAPRELCDDHRRKPRRLHADIVAVREG
jgi:transposase-like protein